MTDRARFAQKRWEKKWKMIVLYRWQRPKQAKQSVLCDLSSIYHSRQYQVQMNWITNWKMSLQVLPIDLIQPDVFLFVFFFLVPQNSTWMGDFSNVAIIFFRRNCLNNYFVTQYFRPIIVLIENYVGKWLTINDIVFSQYHLDSGSLHMNN